MARKMWLQLCQEGIGAGRCTSERLIEELGIARVASTPGRASTSARVRSADSKGDSYDNAARVTL